MTTEGPEFPINFYLNKFVTLSNITISFRRFLKDRWTFTTVFSTYKSIFIDTILFLLM